MRWMPMLRLRLRTAAERCERGGGACIYLSIQHRENGEPPITSAYIIAQPPSLCPPSWVVVFKAVE